MDTTDQKIRDNAKWCQELIMSQTEEERKPDMSISVPGHTMNDIRELAEKGPFVDETDVMRIAVEFLYRATFYDRK